MTAANKPASFTRSIWLTLATFVIFAIVFGIYVYSEKRIDRANELRLQSFLLADELRQSSDDLTRMVQSYVLTGEPIYKRHFQEIIDIREGNAPRPVAYQNIYWDLVLADDRRPRPYSEQTIALLDLMRQAGFKDEEFALLALAKSNSDALTATEYTTIKLTDSTPSPTDASRIKASLMLQNAAYRQAKASIMGPINAFYQMMNQRTLDTVHTAETTAVLMRVVFIAFGLVLLLMLYRTYLTLHAILGGSVAELHSQITRIGSGNFSGQIPVSNNMKHSILGWLSLTQVKLNALNEARNTAELKNLRMTYLYAALSQCNQAIVRCSNEAELFPQICRDAVKFGQMKMAWIGIIDPDTLRVIPVASFGDGIKYLQDIQLSVDGNSPFGQGPTGTAMRNDQPFWCQDFFNDPLTAPWRERATHFGWRSSASLPLHRNGVVTGSFNVYFEHTYALDDAERNLLLEMAMDISYAIDRFELEKQRVNLTQQLQQTQFRMDNILDNIDQVIWSADANTHEMLFLNAAVEVIYGRSADDFFKHPKLWLDAVHPDDKLIATSKDKETREQGTGVAEYRIIRPNGEVRWIRNHCRRVCDENSNIARLDGVVSDITDHKNAQSHIQHLAYYDALTGLPNRTLLDDRLNQAISAAIRNHSSLALMFLDLDHFKNINDTLGHHIGDQLLIQAAKRMQSSVRDQDTVARPGGDEFILVLLDTDTNAAAHVADKILNAMSRPFTIEQHQLVATPSIGIAVYPDDGVDFQSLAQRADAAMYCAKQEGRNRYRFFSQEMQANSARTLLLENALRHALEQNQLQLHYQPQFCIHNGQIIGTEALIRWQHPDLGMISPAEFIPIAENSGQIMAIGAWVLRTALHQFKCWRDDGMAEITLAVNLSAIQFRDARLPELVTQVLAEAQLPHHILELELTESVAMDDPIAAIAIIDKLHALGIRMSVDDFGTGYSSLNYLKRFKVYKLKIDQSFVRDITGDPEDRAIVTAIINLSRSLGFQTIAEGVETQEQLTFLREQGCDEVQGYFFSKPLPAEQFVAFVRAHKVNDEADSA